MTTSINLGQPEVRTPELDIAEAVDFAAATAHSELDDQYGRVARDLRVSLTDRCNLRCTYCMPEEGLDWLNNDHVLTDEEVIRLITLSVETFGIEQVRFTGGEPLLRKGLPDIIAATHELRTHNGNRVQTAITSNGLGLDKKARSLQQAGLDRVNISLDTLDRQRFAELTRRDRMDSVLAGIRAAQDAGLSPIKINTVVMPGINEQDILPLVEFCLRSGLQLRFIEQMPLGPREQWDRSEMITAEDILQRIRQEYDLTTSEKPRGSAPAKLWQATHKTGDLSGPIGVIASVSHPFCGDCDRTRLTADGAVRNCLFSRSETSLRDLMRDGASDEEIADAWRMNMWAKLPGHGINDPGFLQPQRLMSEIGG